MYCPVCGQQQVSQETRFCSRCGFLLTGIEQVIANEGNLPFLIMPKDAKSLTPRKKGLKQGLFIFLLTFLVVPIVAIITAALNAEPYLVAILSIVFFVGGLLRMAYAMLMESNDAGDITLEQNVVPSVKNLSGKSPNALPSHQSIPTSTYVPPTGGWRETNDLAQPSSVTDETTKLLEKNKYKND